jgi:hypothetical protein
MTFHQQLALTILDKCVLAGIVLWFGHWANKRLESHKDQIAEVAELRRENNKLLHVLERDKHARQLDFKLQQLSQFYWPIHARFLIDTALWKIVPYVDRDGKHDRPVTLVPEALGRSIEITDMITNHEQIVAIIQSNMHLANADDKMLEDISAYIRHVAVYKALRAAKILTKSPKSLDEPFPERLIATVATRLEKLQAEFEGLSLPLAGPEAEILTRKHLSPSRI